MRRSINALWHAWRADRRGSTAMMFAISLVPVLLVTGAAVDYARAHRLKTYLKSAVDSAALAGAAASGLDNAGRITLAQSVFQANLPAKIGTVTPAVNIDSTGIVSVTANAPSPATLLAVAGPNDINISVVSRAKLPLFTGEIVMVLDYSSSMTTSSGDGKERWQAMRDAAVDLIDRLKNGQPDPDLKLGLVPFAGHVYMSLPGEYVLGGTTGVMWTNCTIDRKWPHVKEDTTPDPADNATKWGRTDSDDTIGAGEYNDCPNYPANGLVVRPLSNDHTAVKTQLQTMTPYEGTNISAGLSIGWHVIAPGEPFIEGGAYGSVDKTIILLTDGEQTSDSFGPANAFGVSAAEQNIVDTCNAIKAKGVRIITVAFSDDIGTTSLNRLSNCATSGDYFYNPKDSKELAEVFANVAIKISGRAMLME